MPKNEPENVTSVVLEESLTNGVYPPLKRSLNGPTVEQLRINPVGLKRHIGRWLWVCKLDLFFLVPVAGRAK